MSDAIKQMGEQLEKIGTLFTEVTQIENAVQSGESPERLQRAAAIMDEIKELSIRTALIAAASIVTDFNRIANALEIIAEELRDVPDELLPSSS